MDSTEIHITLFLCRVSNSWRISRNCPLYYDHSECYTMCMAFLAQQTHTHNLTLFTSNFLEQTSRDCCNSSRGQAISRRMGWEICVYDSLYSQNTSTHHRLLVGTPSIDTPQTFGWDPFPRKRMVKDRSLLFIGERFLGR